MVGEQGNRTSGTRSASVPQSYWWKRIHNLNARSRLQEVGSSLSCSEKFSSLVSCHRGYSSVAFYAFFSLFVLTFLYAIWKIVSAHSRSARRPGSGNSTSVAKLNPTTHVPTGYASTYAWLEKGNVLDHFHQTVKKLPSFHNENPPEKSFPTIFTPPENDKRSKIWYVNSNVHFPVTEHPVIGYPSPSWTSRGRTTNPFYDYYQGPYNTVNPPLDNPAYPTAPYPSVYNSLPPLEPYPTDSNPYLRTPFRRWNDNQRFQFRTPASNRFPYNTNSFGVYNENARKFSPPLANMSYRYPNYMPTNRNELPQGSYGNSYYGDNSSQNTGGDVETSPSPLITFFKERHNDARKFRHHSKKSRRKRKKLRRKIRKREKKKRNEKQNHSVKYGYIEEIEGNNEKNSKKAIIRGHRKESNHRKMTIKKHLRRKNHEKLKEYRHYSRTQKPKHRAQHARTYKRTHISLRVVGYRHAPYHARHARKQHHTVYNKRLHAKSHKHRDMSISRIKQTRRDNYPTRHERLTVRSHRIHHGGHRNVHVRHTQHRRHRKILDFRLYHLYRKHHSIDDEIHGKWKMSRHRVRTCKLVDQFSTRGTVKMTRRKGGRRYLHTLLICRPIRLRISRRVHRRRYSLKYAQLCSKNWYVSKGIIVVEKDSNKQEIPRYKVQICQPSYAHVNSKEAKIWNISDKFVRKMEKEDEKKSDVKSSSFKHGNKHARHKNKLKKHKKRNEIKGSNKRRRNWTLRHRDYTLSRSHHTLKAKRHRIVSGQKSKPKSRNHLKLGENHRRKLTKLQDLKKLHTKKEDLKASTNKHFTTNKRKGVKNDSDKKFYKKLLKVLKLAKKYDKKKSNDTRSENVFDSLEAVLAQSQNTSQQFTQGKKRKTTLTSIKRNNTRKHHTKGKASPKNTRKNRGESNGNIQALLAKILPVVLKNLHSSDIKGSDSAVTKVTTKPTPKPETTTKPRTSTAKRPPTNKTPPITTKPKNEHIEEIMKNFLPLLLKKNSDSLEGVKPTHKAKPSPTQEKQRLQTNSTENLGLKNLLASLGMGNLVSDNLVSTMLAKGTTGLHKQTINPKQKPILLPKIPTQPQIARPKPSSAVPTIQLPPSLLQPDEILHSETPPGEQSIPSQASAQASPLGRPSSPISESPATPLSALLQAPPPPSSPQHPPLSNLEPVFSPQGNGNNIRPNVPPVNPDPYSRSVLCFGDSLTRGYYNNGHSSHPYSIKLSQLLNSNGRLKYYVKTSGKVREMAHGSMERRLPQVLGNSSRFDWVIILGGTNDVAHVKNFGDDDSFMNQLISIWKPKIVRDIEVLHEISHKYGAKTVLLTIPETAYEAWPNFKTLWVMRNKINQDLREYARRSQGNTVLCDLAAKLPRHSLSPQAQALLWNDHLHLTPFGYDKMAEIVYQCLKPYLRK